MRRRTLNRMRDRLLLFFSTSKELWRQLENMQIVTKGTPNKMWINTRCEFMWIKSKYNNQKGMFAPLCITYRTYFQEVPHCCWQRVCTRKAGRKCTQLSAQTSAMPEPSLTFGRRNLRHTSAANRVFRRSAQTWTQQTARRDIESDPNPNYAKPDCCLELAADLGIEKCADNPR